MFTEVVRGNTLWCKPISVRNGLDTKYYVTEAEAQALRSTLYTPADDVAMVDAHVQLRQLPYEKFLHINLRFRWILEASFEATTQYGRADRMFKRTWWLSRRPYVDLTTYRLPQWFMKTFADKFDAEIDAVDTAQKMVNFFSAWYDASTMWKPGNEMLERCHAVAAF
jgi:hypothetical protein